MSLLAESLSNPVVLKVSGIASLGGMGNHTNGDENAR